MPESFLQYFIHEDLYLLKEDLDRAKSPVAEAEANAAPKPVEAVLASGQNKRAVLVLVANDGATATPPGEKALLMKILASAKLSLHDIALVEFDLQHVHEARRHWEQVAHQALITFGLHSDASTSLYDVRSATGDARLPALHAHALPDLASDDSKKRQLWNGLKQLFPELNR